MRFKTPYEAYRNGQWSLLGVLAVTAINIVLAIFSVSLYFPFSACIPRDVILWCNKAGGSWVTLGVFAAVLILLAFAVCEILVLRQEKFPAFCMAFALYAVDSLVYLVFALPEITKTGFGIMSITEVLLRWYILTALFRADKVWLDPHRNDPSYRAEPPVKKEKPAPRPREDDDEDEGIQW